MNVDTFIKICSILSFICFIMSIFFMILSYYPKLGFKYFFIRNYKTIILLILAIFIFSIRG